VEEEKVFYRVNDSLFSARIEGAALVDSALLVTDPMVPAIHWAFSSN
jgi:hypothetical protein